MIGRWLLLEVIVTPTDELIGLLTGQVLQRLVWTSSLGEYRALECSKAEE